MTMSLDELSHWLASEVSTGDAPTPPEGRPDQNPSPGPIEAAWGSAIAIAAIKDIELSEELTRLEEALPPELGALYLLDRSTSPWPGLVIAGDVGRRTYAVDPVDPLKLGRWLSKLMALQSHFPYLGATVSAGRGFIGSWGPEGPAVRALRGDTIIISEMILVSSRVREILTPKGSSPAMATFGLPVGFPNGQSLTRVTSPSATSAINTEPATPKETSLPDMTWPFGESTVPGEGEEGSAYQMEGYRGRERAPEDGISRLVRKGGWSGSLGASIEVRPQTHAQYRRGAPAFKAPPTPSIEGQRPPPRGHEPDEGAQGSEDEALVTRTLRISDSLEVTVEHLANSFIYLLCQSNFDLRLLQSFTPVADDPHKVESSHRLLLPDFARDLRVIVINSAHPLGQIQGAISLARQGSLPANNEGLVQFERILRELHPGNPFVTTTGEEFQVVATEDATLHPLQLRAEKETRSGRLEVALQLIEEGLSADLLRYQRAALIVQRGNILRRLHHHREAQAALKAGIELASHGLAPSIHVKALNNLARSYVDCRDTDKALALIQESKTIALRHGEYDGLTKANFQEAVALFRAHRYEDAMEAYRRVEDLAKQLDNDHLLAASCHGQALIHVLLCRFDKAEAPLEFAIERYRRMGERSDLLRATADLAEVYLELGKRTEGFFQYRSVLFLLDTGELDFPIEHAALYRARYGRHLAAFGQFEDAKRELIAASEALRSIASPRLPDVLVPLAEMALACGDPDLAQASLEEVGPLLPPLALDVRWRGALAMGRLHEQGASKDLHLAEQAYAQGIEALESGRDALSLSNRSAFLDSSMELWDAMIRSKIKQGASPKELLTVIERVRARWFQDALLAQEPRTALDRQERWTPEPWRDGDVAKALASLPQGMGILEAYCLSDEVLYFWIRNGTIEMRRLGISRQEVEALTQEIADALAEPPPEDEVSPPVLVKASAALLSVCADWLETMNTKDSLGLLLHGPLRKVPFHALPSPLRGPAGDALTFRNPVFYAPSLGVLGHWLRRDAPRKTGSFLALADPLGDLEDAREEAQFLRGMAQTIPGVEGEAISLVGQDATIPALMDQGREAQIIHFATHARGETSKEPASLTLSPHGQGEWLYLKDDDGAEAPTDGLLRVELISQMKLRAALVVLAACEAGVGTIRSSGEGIGLLSWAFLRAGAQRVVSSSWPAHDSATGTLMRRFYLNLSKGLTALRALAKAQESLVEEALSQGDGKSGASIPRAWAHPHFWAAFSLTGNPG